jgi:hypothetical protein
MHVTSPVEVFGAQTCAPGHPPPTCAGVHARPLVTAGGVDAVAVHDAGPAGGVAFAKPDAGTTTLCPPPIAVHAALFTGTVAVDAPTLHVISALADTVKFPRLHDAPVPPAPLHVQVHAIEPLPKTTERSRGAPPVHAGRVSSANAITFHPVGWSTQLNPALHAASAQSVLPLQSLSMPSSQTSGPLGVQPATITSPPPSPGGAPSPFTAASSEYVTSGTASHAMRTRPHPRIAA